jgi:propionyl-CoA carboxylase alpha chain
MFLKILIANRGEIACRIIKTARRMGIRTVAVHSEADRDALHVDMADEAVAIGPAPAAQSYLVAERLVEACRASKAEAVHPGYGFLAESASFAGALEAAGIVWIGPNPQAIAAMGDKIASKGAAAAAGLPTIPGHLGAIVDVEEAVRIAAGIGYPVMIKASAGGGGKGMRIARSASEVAEGFRLARSEARSSFGDDRVFVEKFITEPRHIEIQVLGDKHGNVLHLGDRECSIQRRNQKVVEEAPSPFLDRQTRARMGRQAVALARAVAYDSAGTVEFVVGQDKSFYFLEMNTRLQVEHPVTELVTGIDLVEQMIRIAAGEKLAFGQDAVHFAGSAVEVRVYAEDPERGFLPSTGRLVTYRPPEEQRDKAVTTRNDTGVFEGGEITLHYDPLIAKLCTHAPTREAAVAAMIGALDAFAIEGICHNIPFLSALMQHPRWREGRLSTGFIAEEYPHGFSMPAPRGEAATRLVAVAAAIDQILASRRGAISGRLFGADRIATSRRRVARLGRDDFDIEVDATQSEIQVTFLDAAGTPGHLHTLRSAWRPGDPVWRGKIDGEDARLVVRASADGIVLTHRGFSTEARLYGRREADLVRLMPLKAQADTGKALRCPMPGLVRSIEVREGQEVKVGEVLCVVEAMKMENVLRAERDATVTAIKVMPGDTLAVDTVIMEFD